MKYYVIGNCSNYWIQHEDSITENDLDNSIFEGSYNECLQWIEENIENII